jgi:ribonuclease HI
LKYPEIIINADGASRGNPGPAAIGVVLRDSQGSIIGTVSRRLGTATNNQAEYRAVIAGLEKAVSLGARRVVLKSDSELIVRQINGRYRVKKPELQVLHRKVIALKDSLESFRISHVPRGENAESDRLANQALDNE